MPTATVLLTAVIAAFGLVLNSGMLYLVLSRGRKSYHYLFATVLLICAVWDLGILLSMLRNQSVNELVIYGYIVFIPCVFLSALVYQFTCSYLQQPSRISIFLWAFSAFGLLLIATGIGGRIEGVFEYSWGNLYRPDPTLQALILLSMPVYWFATLSSSWKLYQASKRETSPLLRRHLIYMSVSFIALTLANIKIVALFNIDVPLLLPAGMLVNDLFSALIAIAIVKHHLFNITILLKKGVFYSALASFLIFVFSFTEHLLITYFGNIIGGHSKWVHLISIGAGILLLMPIKSRVEGAVERIFAEKEIEF